MKQTLGIFAACALLSAAALADKPAARRELAAPQEESPLVVVLDPGHGGGYPHEGAHGTRGLLEKTIALEVTKKLQADLEEAGATVLLTREDDVDVSLADRARFANEANADLFVSVHCNSMATRHDRAVTQGVESYFLSPDPTDAEAKMLAELENGGPTAVPLPKSSDPVSGLLADLALGQARNDSAVLAEMLHRALVRKTGATSRGVRQAPFLVLSATKMPSALIEIGFISHANEGRLLSKPGYQEKIASSLAAGIREFAAKVLLRRLLPPNEEARAALLARRTEAAQVRATRHKPAPVAPPPAPAPATAGPDPAATSLASQPSAPVPAEPAAAAPAAAPPEVAQPSPAAALAPPSAAAPPLAPALAPTTPIEHAGEPR